MGSKLTNEEADFLCRFIARGWLHGTRECRKEQAAVNKALRLKYLRKELSEVHFTPAGRIALGGSDV